MERDDAYRAIEAAVAAVAPDASLGTVDHDADFIDELGLDSMDLLGIAEQIHQSTGITIPERDYPKLRTSGAFVDYLVAHSG